MITRSMTRHIEDFTKTNYNDNLCNNTNEYEVNINFDEASKAWMENKKSIGGGCYKYICKRKRITKKDKDTIY